MPVMCRTIEDPKVLRQLETLAMQTVEAQVSNAKNLAQAQAEKLAAEGRAAAGIARAKGEAAVTQAQIDAENLSKLSQVCGSWLTHSDGDSVLGDVL